jgi:hypothetical protein
MTFLVDSRESPDSQFTAAAVLRWLAIVCFGYGLTQIILYIVALASARASGAMSLINVVTMICAGAEGIICAVGGAAMLGGRRAGRKILLLWAAARIAFLVGAYAFSLLSGIAAWRASMPVTADAMSLPAAAGLLLVWTLHQSILPVLVAGVLWNVSGNRAPSGAREEPCSRC